MEKNPQQLYSNVMFVLEGAGILTKDNFSVLPILEQAVSYLQEAILASNPDTNMVFIDEESHEQRSIKISEIQIGEDSLPVISATIGLDPFNGHLIGFALFSWRTKDGKEYSAVYPHIAFYEPE